MAEGEPKLHLPLDPGRFDELADALGDTPETAIEVHRLRRRLCKTYLAGEPVDFVGAVIQGNALPAEPVAFGTDPEAIWRLLLAVEGWHCVNVSGELAEPLRQIIERETRKEWALYCDVYHKMVGPPPQARHPDVRVLTPNDLPLLQAAPKKLRPDGYENLTAALTYGVVACGIVEGMVVALAHTNARTPRHADIGVFTAEAFRGRGLCTAAAAAVAREALAAGQTPVWSAGHTNTASLRVAEKLGFRRIANRQYVVPKKK